ncbi:hypothetical protein D9Q98_000958 [Chlorella vulgaris]|uniref:50S ribosomal protein L18 n=1 Tax=Chlorella vulgaris TaxID=3077 RepID=A0A9D4TZ69_CHLVU|nr:hypothetical protein D9Q98_000958 [Chlorella vulgaris]
MGGLPAPKPHHLKIFLSNKYCYAQVWRTADQHVVAAASTIEPPVQAALKEAGASLSCLQAASRVGELLAERAKQAGLDGVHWRRKHGEKFHGKRKALIEGMKEAGLPLI